MTRWTSATVKPIGVKLCVMVELRPGTVYSPSGGDIFRGLEMRGQERAPVDHFWSLRHRCLPFDREYLENGKSQRYISIRA